MSLYYEAADILSAGAQDGSFKSRIYNNKTLKSKPAHLYALISETAKYDTFLKEVIDNAGFLAQEPKLTPTLAILLVHDHVFAKGGIAAAAAHPLRAAIERHKARIHSEFTRARLRRKCISVETLKQHLLAQKPATGRSQPRWIRVNALKTTLEKQLATTFKGYDTEVPLAEVAASAAGTKVLTIDPNIPDLLALPPQADFTKTKAYLEGAIILQDKASCFPAYLLVGDGGGGQTIGDCIDGCAAPGNKTSHLSALLHRQNAAHNIFACERDGRRSKILTNMMSKTSASTVTVLGGQDFLRLDPSNGRFANVTHLLLDPSCSGSGIVGREDMPDLALPTDGKSQIHRSGATAPQSKKRKRNQQLAAVEETSRQVERGDEEETRDANIDPLRLQKLSALQTRIVEHALAFPAATRVTYSTCSVHVAENEDVVSKVLSSPTAQTRGWRVLRRDEQVVGLRTWQSRGVNRASLSTPNFAADDMTRDSCDLTDEETDACIRCDAGDDQGTMGFFVCGFVRDVETQIREQEPSGISIEVSDEWAGFDD